MIQKTSKSALAVEPKTPIAELVELANEYAQQAKRLGCSREEAEQAVRLSNPQVVADLPHFALMESLWANVQDGSLQFSRDLLSSFGAPLDPLLTILDPLVEIRTVEIKFVEGTPGIAGEPGREITDKKEVLSPERTKLVVAGEATFLGMDVEAEAEFFVTKDQPHCLFKFGLAEEDSSWGIGSVFPSVPIVGAMKFTNPTVILTTSEILYSPALDAGIEKGFNYYGNLKVQGSGDSMVDFVGGLLGIVEVASHVAATPAGKFLLELAVKRDVTLIDGENFKLRFTRSDASFEIGDEPTISMANDLAVILTAKGQDTHLIFTGGIKLEMESITGFFTLNGTGRSSTGELSGEIQNTDEWKPFDLIPGIPSDSEYIPDLAIRQLSVQAGLTYNAPWIDNIGLHGSMRIGNIDGSISVLVDVNDPDHFVLAGSTDHITLVQLMSAMSQPTFIAYTALPSPQKTLLDQVVDVALSDVKVNIVPKATSIGGVHFRDAGVTVAGTVSIWGWQASMYLNVDYNDGITADAEMDPVNLPGILQIQGAGEDLYPQLHMVLGPRMLDLEEWFYISASVTLLGLTSEVQVRITDSGFYFTTSGKIFDLFECTLEASGGALSNDDVFFIKATMKNDLFAYLKREASNAIQAAADEATRKISTAQQAVQSAQEEVNELDRQIAAMRQTIQRERERDAQRLRQAQQAVQSAQEEVNELDRQIAAMRQTIQRERDRDSGRLRQAQQAVQRAQAEVNRIQGEINNAKNTIAYHKRKIEEKRQWFNRSKWYQKTYRWAEFSAEATWRGAAITGLYTEIGTLEAAKATAIGALELAKQTLRGLEQAAKTFPIDADPRMVGLFTARGTANAALEAAKQTLRGLEQAAKTFPIDADPRMIGLFTARETATASLQVANRVLEGVKVSVGALADVGEYIVEYGLGGLLDIHAASFEASLNDAARGKVSLQTELVFMNEEHKFAFSFNFHNPFDSAQDLAKLLLPA